MAGGRVGGEEEESVDAADCEGQEEDAGSEEEEEDEELLVVDAGLVAPLVLPHPGASRLRCSSESLESRSISQSRTWGSCVLNPNLPILSIVFSTPRLL